MSNNLYASRQEIIEQLSKGNIIVITDDENRENEGDFILAAKDANEKNIGFIIRHSSGIICTPMPKEIAKKLDLNLMVENNEDKHKTAFTVSVDSKEDITTGISSKDRAKTIELLGSSKTIPADLTRPGHIFPLIAVDGLLNERLGHTEACVDLVSEISDYPVGVISEIVDDNGNPMVGEELIKFANENNLLISTIEIIKGK